MLYVCVREQDGGKRDWEKEREENKRERGREREGESFVVSCSCSPNWAAQYLWPSKDKKPPLKRLSVVASLPLSSYFPLLGL